MTSVFIEPCDVVFFRDDLPFGAPGNQLSRCQFPPRPSVVAGALRSKVLAERLDHLGDFATDRDVPEAVRAEIGGPGPDGLAPGTFRLGALHLGRRSDGVESAHYKPGRDLAAPGKGGPPDGRLRIVRPAAAGVVPGQSSLGSLAPVAAVLGFESVSGWLPAEEHLRYLAGSPPAGGVVREADVLDREFRVGVGLDPARRTTDEGQLFSSQGVLLRPGWGFVAAVDGCSLLPTRGLIRLGGDGRMARLSPWTAPEPDWTPVREAIARSGRFRWVLQTPAIFQHGWRPRDVREAGGGRLVYERDGLRARLMSAAVDHPELAGGWDLLRGRRKPFRRMVPAGSVFWWEIESGSPDEVWQRFHGRSVSDERGHEGFGLVHLGGW